MNDEREAYLKWREATPPETPIVEPTSDAQQSYASWREEQAKVATERAAILVEQAPPQDDAAKAFDRSGEAQQHGWDVAPELLTDATSDLSKRIEAQTRRAQLMQSSRLAEWVARDPMNAALAQAELANLSTLGGLVDGVRRGTDRQVSGAWYAQQRKRAGDRLADLQERIADKDRTFGSILDEIVEGKGVEDFDANPGYTVAKTYANAVSRYVSSRLTFASEESLSEYETQLSDALDRALSAEAENTARIERTYGRTATVARVGKDVTSAGEAETVKEQLTALGDIITSDPLAFTEWLGVVIAESAPGLGAAALVTATTRSPSAGAATLGLTSYNVGSTMAFDQFVREQGYDLADPEQRAALVNDPEVRRRLQDRAFAYGAVVGLMDAASGRVASMTLANSAVGNHALHAMTQALMGGGGEALGQLASGQQINMVEVMVEGLAEFATAPVEVAFVGGRFIKERRQTAQDRAFFEALAQSAEQSQMKEKVPAKYREAVAALTKDGPVETMYVDAQKVEELFQRDANGTTAEQFIEALPGVDMEAYKKALDTGGVLEIPTASYASDVIGTRFDEVLREHLRTAPERMSAFELKEYQEQLRELTKEAQATAEKAESGQAELEKVAESARVELVSALRRAGRTADVAEREALQAVAFARTTAQRLGIPLEDFLARYPLADVQGALETSGEVRIARITPEVLERVRAPAEQETREDALIEAMREAAEATQLDLETAEPADLERAIEQMYGPATGPVLLNQMERLMPPVAQDDLAGGVTSDFLRRPGWGVVTAARNTAADEAQNAALEAELQRRGIPYRRMEGMYRGNSDGTSFMIFADRETVVELGRAFMQESVLTREGLVFMDGASTIPLAPDDLTTGDAAKSKDYYSVMEDGTAWSVGFGSELFQARDDVVSGGLAGDGRHFTTFFADVTAGVRQQPQRLDEYQPAIELPARVKAFAEERAPFSGNFEDHIQTSIPGYREMQDAVGYVIAQTLGDGALLDIGASEGAMAKAAVQRNPGATAVAMDPNLSMRETFEGKPQVAGVSFDLSAFGSAEEAGQVAWTEDDGTDIPFFDPKGQKFDVVHEAMVFQFISNRRGAQVRRVKEMMKDDGVFLTFEKFGGPAEEYSANEYKKDQYKAQYYDQETLAAKAQEVLQTGGDAVEGMTDLQVSVAEMEQVLLDNFKFVYQVWDSGNFKGFAASDSYYSASRFANGLPDLSSEYATAETPRRVYEARDDGTVMPVPVNEDGTVTLTHWSDEVRDSIDPAHAGTGPLRGAERGRGGPNKSYYGVAVGQPGGYSKEMLGMYRHEVRVPVEELYDLSRDEQGYVGDIPAETSALDRIAAVEERIKAEGYSGYVVMNSAHGATAALFDAREPTRVKDDRTIELFQSGATPDFFSALTREVANAKQAKAPAKDWKSIIQKLPGVKRAEIEWSGVFEWLDAQEGAVTREAVAAYLSDNEVEVETAMSYEGSGLEVDVPSYGDVIDPYPDYIQENADEIYLPMLIDELVDEMNSSDDYEGDNWTADDISETDLATLRERAYQQAEYAYYEEPEYEYFIDVSRDGETLDTVHVIQGQSGDYLYEGSLYGSLDEIEEELRDKYGEGDDKSFEARWADYTEPGGVDYKEVLLTVPSLQDKGLNRGLGAGAFVNDSHFDTPNIVVHARVNYRKADDGSKVMFVEEVQSDLGSYWRGKGGVPSAADIARDRRAQARAEELRPKIVELRVAQDNLARDVFSGFDTNIEIPSDGPAVSAIRYEGDASELLGRVVRYREDGALAQQPIGLAGVQQLTEKLSSELPRPGRDGYERIAEWARGQNKLKELTTEVADIERSARRAEEPFTPFEGETYYALMMKRLLKMAAEEGADKIAWTPAYMQARRWSGAVQNIVQRVDWNDTQLDEETALLTALALGETTEGATVVRNVVLDGTNGTDVLGVDAGGVIQRANGARIPAHEVIGHKLSEVIGGTMATRILAEPSGRIEGQNIVVGGDGYKISYDQQIKKFVDKFAKKYGSRVTVSKTMPDFVTGSNSDPVARVVARYGHQNVMALLRESGLRTPEFWAAFDNVADREIEAARVRTQRYYDDNRDTLDRLANELTELENAESAGAELIELKSNQYERLVQLTNERRRELEGFDDPAVIAATRYGIAIRRGFIEEREVVSVLPDEMKPQGDAVWSVDITPEMSEAAAQAQPLFQRRPEGARGSVLLPTEPGKAPLVTLFPKADLSTFLHESGHYYLHVLQDLNAKGDTPAGMAADWATIRNWWSRNVEGIAKDGGVSQAQVRAYLRDGTTGDLDVDRKVNVGLQEQWARAYEQYLLEGKAPSNALRSAFEAFSAWLLSVYQRARGLDVEINDELRGVFDRLLATDEEIAAATSENSFDALVARSAEELGIDEAEYQKLVRLSSEAQDEARQRLLLDIMAPIRRAKTAEHRAERAEVEEEIRRKVVAKPVHRVREWLANGRWLGDDAPEDLPVELRLDKALLVEEHGPDALYALPRGKRPVWKTGTGISADDVAGWFGYANGSDMLADLATSTHPEQEIKTRVEGEMRKRHGDPLGDGSVEELALEALHGEKRGQLLAAELRAIGKVAKKGKATTRSQAAEVARRTIRSMPVFKAIRSGQYLAAERRAGERAALAVARGDMDEAFATKREQLLNHQLYVESRKADEVLSKVEKRVAKLKKKTVRQNLAGEYLDAIDDILTSYDFRKSITQRAARRRAGLQEYVEMMKATGRENELAIPPSVLDEASRRPYKTLPVAELEGVLDSLRNIEHTARMKQKLRDAQSERELTAVVEGVTANMNEHVKDRAPNRVATTGEKFARGLRDAANLLLNADTILRKLDGFDRGAAYEAIKTPVDDAANWATVEREKAARRLEELYGVYTKREQRDMGKRVRHEALGGSFTKWDLISAALNMGNADNMARLTDKDSGGGFNTGQIDYIKNQLDRRDWEFVQSVWDYIDTFWPLIEARERRLTGVAPKKVQASEVETSAGTFAGGYYPIRYRSDISGMVAADELADVQQRMLAGRYGKAQTRNGHLQERAQGSGGRVLHLGMEVLHMHVGQVIHDLAFSEAVANSWRVLQDPRVRGAFEQKGLLSDHQALELWLQDTATGQLAAGGVFGRLALRAKNGFTLSKLAFNLSTVAIQLTGIAQSVAFLGARDMARGYSTYLANPARTAKEVVEFSPFMQERETTFNRDVNDILGDVMLGPAASRAQRFQQGIARVGFWLMQKVQFYGVDVPTWYAGYHQGLRKYGSDEARARKYADRAVARAQASGVLSDRSAFERGTLGADTRQNGFVRLFTALGSYMFAKGNVAYEVYGRTRQDMDGLNLRALQAALKGAVDMTLLFTVEAIAYNLIKGTLPGDDEDDDTWAQFLAKETALSMMSTMPAVRDLGSSLSGFEAGAYGSVIETFSRPVIQAAQGEADLALFKSLSNAMGVATGLPSGQLNRTVDAWYRLEQGDDVAPIEFIMGRR